MYIYIHPADIIIIVVIVASLLYSRARSLVRNLLNYKSSSSVSFTLLRFVGARETQPVREF